MYLPGIIAAERRVSLCALGIDAVKRLHVSRMWLWKRNEKQTHRRLIPPIIDAIRVNPLQSFKITLIYRVGNRTERGRMLQYK